MNASFFAEARFTEFAGEMLQIGEEEIDTASPREEHRSRQGRFSPFSSFFFFCRITVVCWGSMCTPDSSNSIVTNSDVWSISLCSLFFIKKEWEIISFPAITGKAASRRCQCGTYFSTWTSCDNGKYNAVVVIRYGSTNFCLTEFEQTGIIYISINLRAGTRACPLCA